MDKDTLTLYPKGDLDLVLSKQVKESLDSMLCSYVGIRQLVVNMADVKFMDSSGLGMLISCYKVMHSRKGRMMICDAGDTVYRVLELSGIKKLMPVIRQEPQKTARGEKYGK